MNTVKISCVIPAYNEEIAIENTLKAVLGVGDAIAEIIVVDDCSTDRTRDIVSKINGVKLILNPHNSGKSATIAYGVRESIGDYILMLDADLAGLNSENIKSLVWPVITNQAQAVLSMRGNTPGWMKFLGFDSMCGERVLPRSIFTENIEALSNLKGFGLEVFLNRIIIKNRLSFKSVAIANVKNPMKWNKHNFWDGIRREILMWRDLFKTVSIFEFISQHQQMGKLLIKDGQK